MENKLQSFRRRRFAAALLALVLAFPAFLPVESHGASFTDTSGHWAEAYIERALDQGIVQGYPDGRFGPDQKVTRAEFVRMLNLALGNAGTASVSFRDVASGAWYYTDVRKAVNAAYVAGYEDNTFRPGNTITRQEAAVMLARVVPTYGYSGRLQAFTDYRQVASWANGALSKINGKGYINGFPDGTIRPLDPLTRAQAAKIIGDIIENETIVTSDPVVRRDDTKLSGRIYANNVTIDDDLGEGAATIENCVILGTLIVQGGGTETVTVNHSRIAAARVDREGAPVRLLAKGETSIASTTLTEEGILQTSSLSGTFGTGFESVSLSGSSNAVLRGIFPNVSLTGSEVELILESGSITGLTVGSSARRSHITVESNTSINTASVYAESYFHGTGTISVMNVYADDVTYETRPRTINVGSGGTTPTKVDPRLAISFTPLDGETDVYLDTKITVTFTTAMLKANGNSIANADLPDLVKIRKGSATGSTVAYSGTINSAKTVMTLTPSANLDANTRYYVTIADEVMRDTYGNYNDPASSYFNTGTKTQKLTVTYSPANNTTGVALSINSLTITFSDAITRADGTAITESYLKNSVLELKRGTTAVDYSVSFNTSRTVVTLRPSSNLLLDTEYTFGIKTGTLKTAFGTAVPASSAKFRTTNIAEAAPTATSVAISGTAEVGKTLTGTYTYADVNGDQEGTTTFAWFRSDTPTGTYAAISGATAKTYTLTTADEGKYIKFAVTPVAKTGTLTGSQVLSPTPAGPVILVPEQAPVATNVSISGNAKVNEVLTGSYTYSDKNGDLQGLSTYRWLSSATIDGVFTEISGAYGITYTVQATDLNSYIKFEVTPVAQTGTQLTGTAVISGSAKGPIGTAEAKPFATAVSVSGAAIVGSTLEGLYTYNDANGDLESGTTYRWLANTGSSGGFEAISGATSQTYIITSDLAGKQIMFEVTPRAATGDTTGVAASSAPTGAVAGS